MIQKKQYVIRIPEGPFSYRKYDETIFDNPEDAERRAIQLKLVDYIIWCTTIEVEE